MLKGTLKEQILPDTPLSGGPAILSDHSNNSAPSLPYLPSMGTPQSSHCLRMTADRVPFFKRMMLRGQWHLPSAFRFMALLLTHDGTKTHRVTGSHFAAPLWLGADGV